jgi:hypothetical protein
MSDRHHVFGGDRRSARRARHRSQGHFCDRKWVVRWP